MQVTGWTYANNPHFDNIREKRLKLWSEIMEHVHNPIAGKYDEFVALELLNEDIEIAVIDDLRANNYHFTGIEHQQAPWGTPIIDNKYILCVSTREWGEIMSEAFPEEFGESDLNNYLEWAWVSIEEGKYKRPSEELWVTENNWNKEKNNGI